MSKTSIAPDAPRKYDLVIDLYVSCPAESHIDNFRCFCFGDFGNLFGSDIDCDEGREDAETGLFILSCSEAGGPTGTIREPNSTPMVTS
jgi:hypothetical protein